MDNLDSNSFINEAKNILNYWIEKTLDSRNGGFFGRVTNDGQVITDSPRASVINTRILWTFSTAYKLLKDEKYLDAARHAYDYINKYFIDKEYGGVFWKLDSMGNPIETKKQIYSQAFAIYAYSQYYKITANKDSLDKAIELFKLIEQYSFDPEYPGYFEAYSNDWKLLEDLRLSDIDMNEKKTMNTHLHVIEAYTNLFSVWKDEKLLEQLKGLLRIFLDKIVNPSTNHFDLFFNERWRVKSDEISNGHDIEGSWLLYEAAELVNDFEILHETKEVSIKIAEMVLNQGVDQDGGISYIANQSGIQDSDKHWWPQAEAVVGFYNAYQLTKNKKFEHAALRSWNFINDFMIDRRFGEWYHSVSKDRTPYIKDKVDDWKCPYHNSRVCFEMIERLKSTNNNH